MADAHNAAVSRHLRMLFEVGTVAGLTDGQLLDMFVTHRDEAAFTALIERHGPMVQRVCHEVLSALPTAASLTAPNLPGSGRCLAGPDRRRGKLPD